MSTEKRRRIKRALWCLGLTPVIGGVGIWSFWQYLDTNKFDRLVKEARDAGIPLSKSELLGGKSILAHRALSPACDEFYSSLARNDSPRLSKSQVSRFKELEPELRAFAKHLESAECLDLAHEFDPDSQKMGNSMWLLARTYTAILAHSIVSKDAHGYQDSLNILIRVLKVLDSSPDLTSKFRLAGLARGVTRKLSKLIETERLDPIQLGWVKQSVISFPFIYKREEMYRARIYECLDFARDEHLYGGIFAIYRMTLSYNEQGPLYDDQEIATNHPCAGLPPTKAGKQCWINILDAALPAHKAIVEGKSDAEVSKMLEDSYDQLAGQFHPTPRVVAMMMYPWTGIGLTNYNAGNDQRALVSAACEFLLTTEPEARRARAKDFFSARVCHSHSQPFRVRIEKDELVVWAVGSDGKDDKGDKRSYRDIVQLVRLD